MTHHPDDATLLAYGAGALSEGAALVVAAHCERCPSCLEQVRFAETLGGMMLDEDDDSGVASGFEQCLARVDGVSRSAVSASVAPRPDDDGLPRVLADYIDSVDMLRWRRLARGVWFHSLPVETRGGWTRLFRFAPGVAVPEHSHTGSELTLVLQGSYCDAMGQFGPGDCADLDASHLHQPRVDSAVDCIALISTSGHIAFRNPWYRAGGRLFGF